MARASLKSRLLQVVERVMFTLGLACLLDSFTEVLFFTIIGKPWHLQASTWILLISGSCLLALWTTMPLWRD